MVLREHYHPIVPAHHENNSFVPNSDTVTWSGIVAYSYEMQQGHLMHLPLHTSCTCLMCA